MMGIDSASEDALRIVHLFLLQTPLESGHHGSGHLEPKVSSLTGLISVWAHP